MIEEYKQNLNLNKIPISTKCMSLPWLRDDIVLKNLYV